MLIKILVVGDSTTNCLIIKNLLSEYDILTACNGTETMDMLEEHKGINLMILDLSMPNRDGFHVLKAMKEDDRFKKLRTIILTNDDELDNETEGLELGAVDYIRKPIHTDSLKARINVHVELIHAQDALGQQFQEQSVTSETIFNQIRVDITNISGSKEMENKLRYYDERDEWTGLYNRRYLELILTNDNKLFSTEKRALVSVNLSTMHSLSVTYGFQYSRNLIKKIAEELSKHCANQCLLFNTNEYRFVFYKKGYKNNNELLDLCNSILGTLTSLLTVDRINIDIGVIEIGEDNKNDIQLLFKNLLSTSEEAILIDDEENLICFYDKELEERIFRREMLQRDLSQISVGENEERLFLHYQPILDLRKNSICGFEALARYNSDKLGLVLPSEFIPIIEKTKHIIPIGNIIIRKACEFINKLKCNGYDTLQISINISAIQLLSKGFVENLIDTMIKMKVNPKYIIIELTESAFSLNFEEINRLLGQLSDYGIEIWIDDFGTGYSSFSREQELNIHCLKIDKSFIDKLLFLKAEETITGDIISMAHRLGHCVVAEGVEHEKQMEYLKIHGCDKAQGYLISKILDEESALAFLEHRHTNHNS